MTKEIIEITFSGAMTHAKKLDECATEMDRIAKNRIGSIRGDLCVSWQGDSAEAYVAKLEEVARNMQETAKKMRDSAQKIRKVAEIFRKTELGALEVLQQCTH